MRFRFFYRVPWWLALLVLAVELAALLICLPFWIAGKVIGFMVERHHGKVAGVARPGAIGAYRDWADHHMLP